MQFSSLEVDGILFLSTTKIGLLFVIENDLWFSFHLTTGLFHFVFTGKSPVGPLRVRSGCGGFPIERNHLSGRNDHTERFICSGPSPDQTFGQYWHPIFSEHPHLAST